MRDPEKPFLLLLRARLRKEGLFSLGEVARIEMRAPQISADQQMNRILISPRSVTVGVGGPSQGTVGATRLGLGRELQSQWALAVALHTWMDTEGLLHGAINILFINVSGFSRQTMHYFMVGKNQRKFKTRVELNCAKLQ